MTNRGLAEIVAAIATAILHAIVVGIFELRGLFIAVALVAWSTYIASRVRSDPRVLVAWGLSSQGLRPTIRVGALVATLALAAMALHAVLLENLRLHWHMLPLLLLYPVWGLVQQLLVQGMFVSNVLPVSSRPLARAGAIVVAGLLFGCVHLPDLVSVSSTALMGTVFAGIFVRHRNVWPLGVLHGVLGVPFFFWVLERDPLLELLQSLGLS